MSYTVTLPGPATQHQKTPAWVRAFRIIYEEQQELLVDEFGNPILDEDGNPQYVTVQVPSNIPLRRFFTEGTGEDVRVLRWHEAVDKVRDYVENHTLAELKAVYEQIAGEPYEGVESKKGVLEAVLALWFGFDQDLTLEEMKAWVLNYLKTDVGEWGLGCPGGCGRFWAFVVTKGQLRLADVAAYSGPPAEILDEWDSVDPATGEVTRFYEIRHWEGDIRVVTEVPINRGYLQVGPAAQRFICDRCGASIQVEV